MNALVTFIDPRFYERAEDCADIAPGTLVRIAPDGEYTCNLIRLLPGGERGEQARALLAWSENARQQ